MDWLFIKDGPIALRDRHVLYRFDLLYKAWIHLCPLPIHIKFPPLSTSCGSFLQGSIPQYKGPHTRLHHSVHKRSSPYTRVHHSLEKHPIVNFCSNLHSTFTSEPMARLSKMMDPFYTFMDHLYNIMGPSRIWFGSLLYGLDPLYKFLDPFYKLRDPLYKVMDPLYKVTDALENRMEPLYKVTDPL